MPSIPFGSEHFPYWSYTVEIFWLPAVHQVSVGKVFRGVYVFMTSKASNKSSYAMDWDVFFLIGASVSWIIGETYGLPLGRAGNVFPDAQVQPMPVFLRNRFPNNVPYHAWSGYSMATATMDTLYHCLDFYWQGPGEYFSGVYHWFLLRDVSEPSDFYQSQVYTRNGKKTIDDPPPPEYPLRSNL